MIGRLSFVGVAETEDGTLSAYTLGDWIYAFARSKSIRSCLGNTDL